ncbi:hypothetical protein CRM90_11535 [Mycobacterium sp. ENV421]|uniref:hypothetical protein n=1 Tax=Mycobacterium sp. ENV421 TaxID=1213407 RepID=UPI000C9CAFCB|nr:hypothetical protein [Mycobacterium sp. ENV421]PND57614.1 hypothetical protein CRM90_11535 [Mycobacterium sp. ENV421]
MTAATDSTALTGAESLLDEFEPPDVGVSATLVLPLEEVLSGSDALDVDGAEVRPVDPLALLGEDFEPFEVEEPVDDDRRPDDPCDFDAPDEELAPPVEPAEPVVSAYATEGMHAIAAPMPSATASAPTRPT